MRKKCLPDVSFFSTFFFLAGKKGFQPKPDAPPRWMDRIMNQSPKGQFRNLLSHSHRPNKVIKFCCCCCPAAKARQVGTPKLIGQIGAIIIASSSLHRCAAAAAAAIMMFSDWARSNFTRCRANMWRLKIGKFEQPREPTL